MNLHDTIARLTGTVLKRSPLANLDLRRHGYNQAGQRTNQTRLYGDYVTYTYDNAGQLKTAQAKESGGSPSRLQEQFGYLHDAAGNLAFRTNNALTEAFAVNAVNELATALPSGTLTVAGGTLPSATNVTIAGNAAVAAALYHNGTWALPGAALPSGAATYVATARGSQGVQATASVSVFLPPSVTYGYDPNGNLTNDGNRSFTYDDENRLASVWVANVWRADFVYDGKMRLRERFESVWAGGTRMTNAVTFYVYDGNVVVQERNANNLPAVTYTRGLDLGGSLQGAGGVGGLLARTDNSVLATQPSAAHAYYHADGNGNITCLINSSNAVMARYLYDPFGRILSQSGALAAANLYRFSSKEFHVNSGMYYYLYRFYDPNLQRWPNRDPAMGWVNIRLRRSDNRIAKIAHWETYEGLNPYTSCLNDPVALCDNNGLWTFGIGFSGWTGIWGAAGFSGGFFFGHGPGGWSWGFLGSGFAGSGGFGIGGGGFVQITSAPCVSALKGSGGTVGGSAGEGPSFGGGAVFGNGYGGVEGTIGGGIGTPIQIYAGGTITSGPTWGAGASAPLP